MQMQYEIRYAYSDNQHHLILWNMDFFYIKVSVSLKIYTVFTLSGKKLS